jgi:hypothetical protein
MSSSTQNISNNQQSSSSITKQTSSSEATHHRKNVITETTEQMNNAILTRKSTDRQNDMAYSKGLSITGAQQRKSISNLHEQNQHSSNLQSSDRKSLSYMHRTGGTEHYHASECQLHPQHSTTKTSSNSYQIIQGHDSGPIRGRSDTYTHELRNYEKSSGANASRNSQSSISFGQNESSRQMTSSNASRNVHSSSINSSHINSSSQNAAQMRSSSITGSNNNNSSSLSNSNMHSSSGGGFHLHSSGQNGSNIHSTSTQSGSHMHSSSVSGSHMLSSSKSSSNVHTSSSEYRILQSGTHSSPIEGHSHSSTSSTTKGVSTPIAGASSAHLANQNRSVRRHQSTSSNIVFGYDNNASSNSRFSSTSRSEYVKDSFKPCPASHIDKNHLKQTRTTKSHQFYSREE